MRVNFHMADEPPEYAEQFSSIAAQMQEVAERYEPIRRQAQEFAEQSSSLRRMSEEFARDYEPIRQEAALAAKELRDAQSAFSRADMAHMGQLRALTAQMEPLVKSVRASLFGSVKLDLDLQCVELDSGLASIAPVLDGLAKNRVDWAALSGALSRAVALPRSEPTGMVALPKMAASGTGQVVLPGEAPARHRTGHLQRIGALQCGQVYAMLFVIVLIALMPELPDDVGKVVFVITVLGLILRNGER